MSKGGGGGGVQEVEQTTTNLPEYARPFYENLLDRATYESERGYEGYMAPRLADFDPYEMDAMGGIADMAYRGDPMQLQQASELAAGVGYQDPNQAMQVANAYRPDAQYSGYFAGDIDSGYGAGNLGQGFQAGQRDSGYMAQDVDSGYQAGDIGSDYQAMYRGTGYQPMQFDAGYDPSARGSQFIAEDLLSQYAPQQYETGYQGREFDAGYVARELGQDYTARDLESGFEAGSVTDQGVLEQYMNPYQQLVTDVQKREARREADKSAADIGLQAAGAGAFGGYREGVLLAEQDRNLQQQLSDIQATGDQAAFNQALQAFEADRGARG